LALVPGKLLPSKSPVIATSPFSVLIFPLASPITSLSACNVTIPVPPVTVTAAWSLRSARGSSALNITSPPSWLAIGFPAATVKSPRVTIVMSSFPESSAGVSVIVTPDRPSKAAIVSPPSKSRMWMSPEPVLADSVFTDVLTSLAAPASPSPIPLPARNATWSPTMFGDSPVKLSLIAPESSNRPPATPS